jgi:hypothetical protein
MFNYGFIVRRNLLIMTYKEKIQYAEEVQNAVNKGIARKEIIAELKGKSLYNADIEKVLLTADKSLLEQNFDEIRACLLNHIEKDNKSFLPSIAADNKEVLVAKATEKIIADRKTKVGQLYNQGLSEDEIIENVSNAVFSEEDAKREIERFKKFHVAPSGKEKADIMLEAYIYAGGSALIVLFSLMINFKLLLYAAGLLFARASFLFYKAKNPPGLTEMHSQYKRFEKD